MEKQKLKEKSNVGALSVRNTRKNLPSCAQKGNKGITLVALIITIIVLLILAVVAIRAVQGDGIITKAKEAKSATTVAQEKEQIGLAVNEWQIQKNYQNDAEINFKLFMKDKLSDVASIPDSDPDDGPLTITMKDTGNKYTMYDNGKIAEHWKNNGDGTLSKGDIKVELGKTTYQNADVQQKLGGAGGSYTGTWTVIGAEGDKLKLVSTTNVTSDFYLGWRDEGAKTAKPAADESNPTDAEKLEKAVWSYNNAVITLDTEAKIKTGIESARSIRIDDIENLLVITNEDKGSNYEKQYRYYYQDDETNNYIYSQYKSGNDWLPSAGTKTSYETFRSFDKTVTRKDPAELSINSYAYDISDKQKLDYPCMATDSSDSFWIASRGIDLYPKEAKFGMYVNYMNRISTSLLFSSHGVLNGYLEKFGIRAVIYI